MHLTVHRKPRWRYVWSHRSCNLGSYCLWIVCAGSGDGIARGLTMRSHSLKWTMFSTECRTTVWGDYDTLCCCINRQKLLPRISSFLSAFAKIQLLRSWNVYCSNQVCVTVFGITIWLYIEGLNLFSIRICLLASSNNLFSGGSLPQYDRLVLLHFWKFLGYVS